MLPVLKMSTARWWYLLALIIITLDQLSKYWVQANFELYERLPLLSFLDFTLVYNEGAAWSFLSDAGGWQRWLFTAISLGVSVVLVVWMARLQGNQHLLICNPAHRLSADESMEHQYFQDLSPTIKNF